MIDKQQHSTRRRGAAQASTASAPNGGAHGDERRARSFENVVGRWSVGLAKEGLGDELGATQTLMRGAQALRQMQLDVAARSLLMHDRANGQLHAARSLSELAGVGLTLAQANAESALRYWSEFASIVSRSGLEGWSGAVHALAGANGVGRSAAGHWLDTALHARTDTLEAQAEHVVNPLTASPLLWPAQEALREAATLGARGWNDWLGAALKMPGLVQANGSADTPTQH